MKRELATGFGRASVVLMSTALGSIAQAAPPPSLRVGGEGTCPAPGQVVAVLRRLLLRTRVTADTGSLGPEDAVIDDQGSQFRVAVDGQERTFVDAGRACDERAQHAAVFVALILDPPIIGEPAAEPPPPPPAPPVAPAPEPPRAPPSDLNLPRADLTLGGSLLVAPEVAQRKTALASGAAAWIRGKRGFHLGFGVGLLHGSLHFYDADADAWWIPIDLAAGYTLKSGAWEFGAEIGPEASVLSIVGEDLQQAHRQVRLEIGGRVSVLSRFWLDKKFALLLSVDAVFRPMPYALQIDPEGEVGRTPAVWVGASAGLSVALE